MSFSCWESRSYSITPLCPEVAAKRLRAGEKTTRPGGSFPPSVNVRIRRRAGTSHRSTAPSYHATARKLPSGEKLVENPRTDLLVSVTRELLRVCCQRYRHSQPRRSSSPGCGR